MKKHKTLTTPEQIKAFSDPYRLQILFNYKSINRPATVKEIADKMGETPAKVHYHVKKMLEAGILVLSHTKEIKGIIAKYYQLTAEKFSLKYDDSNPQIAELVKSELQRAISSIYDQSKKEVLDEVNRAIELHDKHDDVDDVNDIDDLNIMLSNIYLSNEEVNELKKLIEKFSEKNKNKKNKEGLKKFHFFSVVFPLESESNLEAEE